MSWIDAAILGAALIAVVNILESNILSKRVPSLQVYLLAASFFHLTFGLLLVYLFPLPKGINVGVLLIAILSGLLRGSGVALTQNTMRREEVSQVIPVVFTYPVFVAIMAMLLLRETLSYLQWLAIIIVVAGAVMVSLKKSPSGATTWLGKGLLLLFGASFLLALGDVASKYALGYFSTWNMFAFSGFGFGGIFWAVSMRPHFLRGLDSIRHHWSTMFLIAICPTLAAIGIALGLWAMGQGPVSLVSTILGSRPIFVTVYALVVSNLFPGFLMRTPAGGMLALRLVATVMIVGGISIIYLT